ncbi:hypothetical protein Bca4012_059125 [Brassica carinata]
MKIGTRSPIEILIPIKIFRIRVRVGRFLKTYHLLQDGEDYNGALLVLVLLTRMMERQLFKLHEDIYNFHRSPKEWYICFGGYEVSQWL